MDVPSELKEVSGLEVSDSIFWMVNDSGNAPFLYGLNNKGAIIKALKINAKNRDWEDLTTDPEGNIYIGNFGNNSNSSKQLSILKILKKDLNSKSAITPEVIAFKYPNQKRFPPKKNKRHFDCEAFFFYKDSLYLFTKSRSPKERSKTNLYSLPAKAGQYDAQHLDTFNTCNKSGCWVTSADINKAGNKIALLAENNLFVFTDFEGSNFFKGAVNRYDFDYKSQKESVCFKNDSILYIADEFVGVSGGNVYEFPIK